MLTPFKERPGTLQGWSLREGRVGREAENRGGGSSFPWALVTGTWEEKPVEASKQGVTRFYACSKMIPGPVLRCLDQEGPRVEGGSPVRLWGSAEEKGWALRPGRAWGRWWESDAF